MDDRISGATFLAADGVEDWRAIWGGGWALAHFRTTSYEEAVALAHAIGTLASAADHPADLDVRHDSVTVRLFSGEIGELSVRDVELARRISDVARRHGASPDSGAVQHVQIAIDAHDIAAVRPFWAAILGYDPVYDEDLFDALRRGPTVWFQQAGTPRAHDGALPRGRVRPARSGAATDRRRDRRRRSGGERRARPGLVDARRRGGQQGRRRDLDVGLRLTRFDIAVPGRGHRSRAPRRPTPASSGYFVRLMRVATARGPRRLLATALCATMASLALAAVAVGASGPFPAPGTASEIATLVAQSHAINQLPGDLVPPLKDLSQDSFGHYYPSTGLYGCVTTTQCDFAHAHASRTVVLYGDSHAAMWLSALIPSITAAKERLVLLWYPFCPTANVQVWNPLTKSPNTKCATYRTKFIAMIHSLHPVIVLLADRTSGNRSYQNQRIPDSAWRSGELHTIMAIRSKGTKVAVIGDVSIFSSNVADCLAAHPSSIQTCSVTTPNPRTDQHFSAERAAAAAAHVTYLNPETWLCTTVCSPVVGKYAVFFDQFHLTATYAAFLAGVFGTALRHLR